MKCKLPAVVAFAFFFFSAIPSSAQHGGGGHASGGFSGHSFGHSAGHVRGHLFGHSSGSHPDGKGKGSVRGQENSEEPPLAGAVMEHGKAVQMPGPIGLVVPSQRSLHRAAILESGFARRNGVFPLRNNFGLCASFAEFPERRFYLRGDFDCFADGFFFDPFFISGLIPEVFGAGEFSGIVGGFDSVHAAQGSVAANAEEGEQLPEEGYSLPEESKPRTEKPLTLLQLTDGSMYGVIEYWVESGRLHYIANYGGENSLPLARIDMEQTAELNASQGVEFVLRPKLPANPQ
jgi:hypothetical protein